MCMAIQLQELKVSCNCYPEKHYVSWRSKGSKDAILSDYNVPETSLTPFQFKETFKLLQILTKLS